MGLKILIGARIYIEWFTLNYSLLNNSNHLALTESRVCR